MAAERICSIEGCGNKHDAKGYCKTHYLRMRRHGDPTKTVNGRAEVFLNECVLPYQGDECIHWPFGRSGKGRGQIRYKGEDLYVHRLVCRLVNGEPPTPDSLAIHECGNGHLGCVTPKHLRWGTHSDNRLDLIVHCERPDKNVSTIKLSRDDVRKIRALKGRPSATKTGAQFGVRRQTISDIWSGRTWSWLT